MVLDLLEALIMVSQLNQITTTATAVIFTTGSKVSFEQRKTEGDILEAHVTKALTDNGYDVAGLYTPGLTAASFANLKTRPQRPASPPGAKSWILPDLWAMHMERPSFGIEVKGKGKLYDAPPGFGETGAVLMDDYHHHDMRRFQLMTGVPVMYVIGLGNNVGNKFMDEILVASVDMIDQRMRDGHEGVTGFRKRAGDWRNNSSAKKVPYVFPRIWFQPLAAVLEGHYKTHNRTQFFLSSGQRI